MLRVVADEQARAELALDLDELLREGARRMLAVALEAEIDASITAHAELTDTHGHRLVRRNGHAPARQLATGAGQVEVARPRVDDRRVDPATGERAQFQSVILPRWCRRSPKVAEVLPLRYLHGLSSSDFVPALEGLFGAAAGLSASVVTRLTAQWQAERAAFAQRDLSEVDDVSCWADGIHFTIRLGEQGRLCRLVIVGVRADGRKELVAVADGERESTDAWAELLRDLRRRGMGAPVVGVGDGALGLWRALREVFPATREQRCWVHKVRNVRPLYRAYLLKEELRLVVRVKGPHAVALLDAWLSWARRCRIPAFTKLARTVTAHRAGIVAARCCTGCRTRGWSRSTPSCAC